MSDIRLALIDFEDYEDWKSSKKKIADLQRQLATAKEELTQAGSSNQSGSGLTSAASDADASNTLKAPMAELTPEGEVVADEANRQSLQTPQATMLNTTDSLAATSVEKPSAPRNIQNERERLPFPQVLHIPCCSLSLLHCSLSLLHVLALVGTQRRPFFAVPSRHVSAPAAKGRSVECDVNVTSMRLTFLNATVWPGTFSPSLENGGGLVVTKAISRCFQIVDNIEKRYQAQAKRLLLKLIATGDFDFLPDETVVIHGKELQGSSLSKLLLLCFRGDRRKTAEVGETEFFDFVRKSGLNSCVRNNSKPLAETSDDDWWFLGAEQDDAV